MIRISAPQRLSPGHDLSQFYMITVAEAAHSLSEKPRVKMGARAIGSL